MEESVLRIEENIHELLLMLESVPSGIIMHDAGGRLLYANKRAADLHDYSREEFMAIGLQQITAPESGKLVEARIQEVLNNGEISFEVEHIKKDGTILPLLIYVKKTIWNGRSAFISTQTDITELKQAENDLRESEKKYRELSIVDDLTQLYNSRYFHHQLRTEIDRATRYGQPLTLLLLDLDNFKAFNDSYGHVEGDEVLSRLGQVVKRCLRDSDSAYRYGGEEFTILLPMTTSEDGVITAERIRTGFTKEIFSPVPSQSVHATVSIGVAQYKPGEGIKVFVHRVDQLMYRGKNNGKDQVYSENQSE